MDVTWLFEDLCGRVIWQIIFSPRDSADIEAGNLEETLVVPLIPHYGASEGHGELRIC